MSRSPNMGPENNPDGLLRAHLRALERGDERRKLDALGAINSALDIPGVSEALRSDALLAVVKCCRDNNSSIDLKSMAARACGAHYSEHPLVTETVLSILARPNEEPLLLVDGCMQGLLKNRLKLPAQCGAESELARALVRVAFSAHLRPSLASLSILQRICDQDAGVHAAREALSAENQSIRTLLQQMADRLKVDGPLFALRAYPIIKKLAPSVAEKFQGKGVHGEKEAMGALYRVMEERGAARLKNRALTPQGLAAVADSIRQCGQPPLTYLIEVFNSPTRCVLVRPGDPSVTLARLAEGLEKIAHHAGLTHIGLPFGESLRGELEHFIDDHEGRLEKGFNIWGDIVRRSEVDCVQRLLSVAREVGVRFVLYGVEGGTRAVHQLGSEIASETQAANIRDHLRDNPGARILCFGSSDAVKSYGGHSTTYSKLASGPHGLSLQSILHLSSQELAQLKLEGCNNMVDALTFCPDMPNFGISVAGTALADIPWDDGVTRLSQMCDGVMYVTDDDRDLFEQEIDPRPSEHIDSPRGSGRKVVVDVA